MTTTRTPFIAGNWKMNLDHLQSIAFVQKLAWTLQDAGHDPKAVEVAVFPPFTDLRSVQTLIAADKLDIGLGAQDLSPEDSGAYTGDVSGAFLAALGHPVGKSLLEQDQLDTVREYLERAKSLGVDLQIPTDVVVAAAFAADADHETVPADRIESTAFGADGIGLDIGPETAEAFAQRIGASRTVFWNGPMGVFELPAFAAGTRRVAQALTEIDGLSVVGGGDSAAAVRALGFEDDAFGHISTGGGASLEFLEGKRLPGLEVLGFEGAA